MDYEGSGEDFEFSGEEPIVVVSAADRLHEDVADGLGWGMGLFTGIVIVIAVMYLLMFRKTRRITY